MTVSVPEAPVHVFPQPGDQAPRDHQPGLQPTATAQPGLLAEVHRARLVQGGHQPAQVGGVDQTRAGDDVEELVLADQVLGQVVDEVQK